MSEAGLIPTGKIRGKSFDRVMNWAVGMLLTAATAGLVLAQAFVPR
jgi:hypothetical protein